MGIRDRFRRLEASSMSWKTSAKVNTTLVSALSTILLGALVYGLVVKRDLGVNSTFPIFRGSCQTASGLNIFLHLVLNILGTLILASSNFFMQLVAAPSRAELDRAHHASKWMDIGVPTLRNFASLSGFKRISWLVLMVSSIPIHLLFNSAIFYVESQRAFFTMTIAAQPFLQGATYYPPGASLWNMKVPGNCTEPADLEIATQCSKIVSPLLGLWDINGFLVTCLVSQMATTSPNQTCREYVLQRHTWNPKQPLLSCLSDDEFYDPTSCYKGGIKDWPEDWAKVGKSSTISPFDPVANGGRRINCTQPATIADAKLCINQVMAPTWQPVNNRSKQDYLNRSSPVNTGIARAATAVERKWERLDFDACRREYLECGQGRGLRNHGDVVVVLMDILPTTAKVEDLQGWTRNQLFPKMSQSDAAFWDDLVPANAINPLLYTAECTMKRSFTKGEGGTNQCRNTCGSALGYGSLLGDDQTPGTMVQAESPPANSPDDYWPILFWRPFEAWEPQMRSGMSINTYNRQDRVAYCLAEVLDASNGEGACTVGMSNVVLLVVTLCVLAKTIQSLLVTRTLVWKRNQPPLITLGDAIDSFLRNPDPATLNMCTLSHSDLTSSYLPSKPKPKILPVDPRPWKPQPVRYHSALPFPSTVVTTTLFLSVLIASLALLALAMFTSKRIEPFGVNSQSFILLDRSTQNHSGSFTEYITVANIPQLVVSLCYLRFNAFLTRIHVVKEWAEMGITYRPLRVSQPKGLQTSRYTLNLPLKWAVPPIILSITLHFLVANSLYIFISEGGYFTTANSQNRDSSVGLSPEGFVGLGYSTSAIIASIVVFSIMVLVPVWLSWRCLPGKVGVVGTNSLAISAACHPSGLTKAGREDEDEQERGDQSPVVDEEGSLWSGEKETTGVGDYLAESRIRWGVLKMSEGFYEGVETGFEVGHLSFGVREDGVEAPTVGQHYM